MPTGWSLKQIKIEGFRGYRQPRTLDLCNPLTLIEGPQRAGKSSTLTAIEWALFGDEVGKKAIGIDERKEWLVRNRKTDEAIVELVLHNGTDELKIYRSDKKEKNHENFFYEINRQRVTDMGHLHALLGISAKDYFSSVHLHQEVVRALLTEEPKNRRDMLDRLLGLSGLRNIIDGIKQGKLGEVARDAQTKFNNIELQLTAIITSKRPDIQRHKTTAASKGVDGASFSAQGAGRFCTDTRGKIEAFAAECGLATSVLPAVTDLDSQRVFSESSKQAVRNLRNEQPDLERQGELLQNQSKLQGLRATYSTETKKLSDSRSAREVIVNKDGEVGTIQGRIGELQMQLEAAKRKRTEVDKRAGVIEEAIKYFDAFKDKGPTQPCPVCGEKVPDVSHLRVHLSGLREELNKDLAPVQKEIEGFDSEIARLKGQIQELNRLGTEIESQKQKLSKAREAIASELCRSIADSEDPNAIVNGELTRIQGELDKIKTIVEQSNQKLNAIDDTIQRLDEILKVLELEADIDSLLKIKDTQEYKDVYAARESIEQLVGDMDLVREAVESVLQAEARKKLQTARNAIADYFKRLAKRPDFQEIEIDPESYEILGVSGAEKTPVLSVFNQGDMNCAAISIFLGLGVAQEVSHKLGFVILDDPSQSLDEAHRGNLAELINSLPQEKQIVISTSEGELADVLFNEIQRAKKRYRFKEWSEFEGTQPNEA